MVARRSYRVLATSSYVQSMPLDFTSAFATPFADASAWTTSDFIRRSMARFLVFQAYVVETCVYLYAKFTWIRQMR